MEKACPNCKMPIKEKYLKRCPRCRQILIEYKKCEDCKGCFSNKKN